MGIQVNNPDSMPAIVYDKIHMTKLEITQPAFENDSLQPKYEVLISYRHYGVTNGIRYYKNEDVNRVAIDDFLVLAMQKVQSGDTDLINALQSIEIAVAAIISDQTNTSATVV